MKVTKKSIDNLILENGVHKSASHGMSLLEAASWISEEQPFSDSPSCVCPVIGDFVRPIANLLSKHNRQSLKTLLPLIIGSTNPDAVVRRGLMAADIAVRVFAPMALRGVGLETEAIKIESLPEIVDEETSKAAYDITRITAKTVKDVAAAVGFSSTAALAAVVSFVSPGFSSVAALSAADAAASVITENDAVQKSIAEVTIDLVNRMAAV